MTSAELVAELARVTEECRAAMEHRDAQGLAYTAAQAEVERLYWRKRKLELDAQAAADREADDTLPSVMHRDGRRLVILGTDRTHATLREYARPNATIHLRVLIAGSRVIAGVRPADVRAALAERPIKP